MPSSHRKKEDKHVVRDADGAICVCKSRKVDASAFLAFDVSPSARDWDALGSWSVSSPSWSLARGLTWKIRPRSKAIIERMRIVIITQLVIRKAGVILSADHTPVKHCVSKELSQARTA